MTTQQKYTVKTSLIVALGGFLMGFDASVISGVVRFIEPEFDLSKWQLGFAVSSLTLTATLGMMLSGPLSNAYGRRYILRWAAVFYAVSALASALAPNFTILVIARMLGGFGVGASLIIAPMYIAEIAPPRLRGRLVSFNQLNIVLGISVAFFTNYLILRMSQSDNAWAQMLGIDVFQWRWMLGLETLPAILYFSFLFFVPRSPRWLLMKGRDEEAFDVLTKVTTIDQAVHDMNAVKASFAVKKDENKARFSELFKPALSLVLFIGVVIAILQQITGINSVFFYAPMIFEQTGIGADASFSQAILVGLTNLIFTIFAILFIDRFGRKILLLIGLSGITVSMLALSWGFYNATYTIPQDAVDNLPQQVDSAKLSQLIGKTFTSDVKFKQEIKMVFGDEDAKKIESDLMGVATKMNSWLVLLAIVGFVASFAISLGPVMWVLFSEIFPNYIRGIAISFVGFINSGVSFSVQLIFPWELATLGSSATFLIYGLFAAVGLAIIAAKLPETKDKSLEELEKILIRKTFTRNYEK